MCSYLRNPLLVLSVFLLNISFIQLANASNQFLPDDSKNVMYINTYKHLALKEMQRSRIPASITLAQAILESNAGYSYLATNGNNHFGIKCHNWNGPTIFRDDEHPNECFRKYSSVEDSYQDHSEFLENPRYQELFSISPDDYVNWAYGLKKSGYATDSRYAEQLIDIIERYKLYALDNDLLLADNSSFNAVSSNQNYYTKDEKSHKKTKQTYHSSPKKGIRKSDPRAPASAGTKYNASEVFYYNHIKTVTVNTDITPRQVARAYDVDVNKLCTYNDIEADELFPANTKVYLEAKRNKGPVDVRTHKVLEGETMHEISQRYGIKLEKLYKLNILAIGAEPLEGEIIYLRSKAPKTPLTTDDVPEDYNTPSSYPTNNNDYTLRNNNTTYSNNGGTYSSQNTTTYTTQSSNTPTRTATSSYNTNTYQNNNNTYYQNNGSSTQANTTSYGNSNTGNISNNNYYNTTTPSSATTTYGSSSSNPSYNSSSSNNYPGSTTTYQNTTTTYSSNPSSSTTYGSSTSNTNYNNTGTSTTYINSTSNATTTYPPATPLSPGYNTYSSTTSELPATSTTTVSTVKNYKQISYVVQKGDTLYNISKRMNTSVDAIKRLNNLPSNDIKIGQQLQIAEGMF